MLILYRCPQCESLYCGPAACRFTGLKNNGRAGEALAGMNARSGAMCNGQRSADADQPREAPTPAAHHYAAPQASHTGVVQNPDGEADLHSDTPAVAAPMSVPISISTNPQFLSDAFAPDPLGEAMTKLKKEMEEILKGETDAAGRPQEI